MRTLVLGGAGLLGSELKKIDKSLICLSHWECDTTEFYDLDWNYEKYSPEMIILCAGKLTNANKHELIHSNIIGTANTARFCINRNIRLVYISTDYVYKGDLGNYKETDPLLPSNNYAWSKLGGECAVQMVENSLIIRTSFGKSEFEHAQAYNNKWTNKDYVDVIAPMILQACNSDLTGVINIGTEKKTMLKYARQRNPEITGKPLTDNSSPRNTTLNLCRWKSFQKSIHPAEFADTEN